MEKVPTRIFVFYERKNTTFIIHVTLLVFSAKIKESYVLFASRRVKKNFNHTENLLYQMHNDPGSNVVLTKNHIVNSLCYVLITLINSLVGEFWWILTRSGRLRSLHSWGFIRTHLPTRWLMWLKHNTTRLTMWFSIESLFWFDLKS